MYAPTIPMRSMILPKFYFLEPTVRNAAKLDHEAGVTYFHYDRNTFLHRRDALSLISS
ncbi:hypothetical protein OIU79_017502 [Salix purpurea]|uniref:Uncharacterized protein n=1 Tax=Salix purpurea TaxID=77065 RepID=A0A9Q0WW07_SALPP|nr:hypothetical protein OIU79_017502 [Salix purpurea]